MTKSGNRLDIEYIQNYVPLPAPAAPRFLTRGKLYSVSNAQSPAEVGNFYPLPLLVRKRGGAKVAKELTKSSNDVIYNCLFDQNFRNPFLGDALSKSGKIITIL